MPSATGGIAAEQINYSANPVVSFGGAPPGTGAQGRVAGTISRQILAAAGASPTATGADKVLAVYKLPAGSLDAAGRALRVRAAGTFAATANNKLVKIVFNATAPVVGGTLSGGTVVATTGTVATNDGGWELDGLIYKRGIGGANTQTVQMTGGSAKAVALGAGKPADAAAVESGDIWLALVGNATTAASDITWNLFEISGCN